MGIANLQRYAASMNTFYCFVSITRSEAHLYIINSLLEYIFHILEVKPFCLFVGSIIVDKERFSSTAKFAIEVNQ
jgi:hypothetical protein